MRSFSTSISCLLLTLAFMASNKAVAQPNDSLEQGRASRGSISADSEFRPVLTTRKVKDLIEDCTKLQFFEFCDQDVLIHLSSNTTPVVTGFENIDHSAPGDIKGYIYSMSTAVGLNNSAVEELDEWIAGNLVMFSPERHVAVRVPNNLQGAITPLLYPEQGILYLVFNNGEVSASLIKSNNFTQEYKGLKYYNRGQYSLRVGPASAKNIEEFSNYFPELVRKSEGIVTEWWPSGVQRSNLTSISFE